MRGLVLVGGPQTREALDVFRSAGYVVTESAEIPDDGVNVAAPAGGASGLRAADARGLRYMLVHVGPDDAEPEGSFVRAHHRVSLEEVAALAERVRLRERPLLTCLAFAYKNGLPAEADWVVDARFLDNPYWVPELKPLSGLDQAVRDHVLGQASAVALLDRLEALLREVLPRYDRSEVVVAFGCTGGRHRSVVLAAEMARRLEGEEGMEVVFSARDL